jgi:predicted nucleotidyltransferase
MAGPEARPFCINPADRAVLERPPELGYIFLMRRDEIVARLKIAEPALRQHGVAALYLFGSHARDEAQEDSDIDLFIDRDRSRPFGFDEFMDIYLLLQARLGGNVDYGTREGLHPELRPAIERQALRVF